MEYGILGEMTVYSGGRSLALGPARQRLVLGALIADVNRVVPVDRLMARVWGEDPPQRARSVLTSYVSRLRQALGNAALAWRSGGYMLVADRSAVDVHRFHDLCDQARATTDDTQIAALLTEALRLWRGPALTGLDGQWALTERNRLNQQRLAAEHDLIDARLRTGHCEDLVADLGARVGEHPLDERAAGQYLLALYRAGRAADALEHYRQVQSRLADELGIDPGRRLQELHQQILRADPTLTMPAEQPPEVPAQLTAGPVSTGVSAMHSLRGDIAAFTGRDEETTRLFDAVTTGDVRAIAVHTVDGMAGVGKTAFAIHVAHRLVDRFPDGQLFVELHGHTPGLRPVPANDALASLLLATGVPGSALPVSVEDRARLWRHQVAGKRVLVVLDDAADHDQVRPLLPGTAGSLVLITSRHRLPALDAVVPLTLPVLPADQATRMLHRLARIDPDSQDPDAAAAVVRMCGQLPLALALAAGQLRNHPTWTVRHLVDQLAASDARLETLAAGDRSVAVAFDMSFTALPAHHRRLLCLLGAHPGPEVDAFAVAALLDAGLAEARRGLEHLHADHLIEETAPGRFQMHDLVRAYAQLRAGELDRHDRDDALARALRYYLHTTIAATDNLQTRRQVPVVVSAVPPRHRPALADDAVARAWLVQELPTLAAYVEHAAGNGQEAMAIELAAAAHPFLRLGNQWRRALAVHETALSAAVRLGDQRAQANTHYMLGYARRMLCEFDAATKHLADALALYTTLDDHGGQAHALLEMGVVGCMRGHYADAATLLIDAGDLFLALDNRAARASAMKYLGFCHYYLGHYDRAMSILAQVRLSFVALGEEMEEADTLRILAGVMRQRGELQQAYEAATRSVRLAEETGNRLVTAFALLQMGLAQRDLGDHAAALVSLARAEELCTAVGFRPVTARTRTVIGTVHRALGQYATAAQLMLDAVAEQRLLGLRDDEVDTLIELGALAFDYPEAGDPQDYYRQALDIARDIGLAVGEARALAGLGR
jgi:DNA-binding SARP family transcriptional activator/tetratricopeptide (TPR) repeat protein